jgi:Domain of unknown function (DUF1814).
MDNSIETMREVFEGILLNKFDDAIVYDLKIISIKSITEFEEFPGINVTVTAMLDKTRVPISIDIGFGDVIYPERIIMDFPTLLDMEVPKIYAYSLSSVVAEKFEAIEETFHHRKTPLTDIVAFEEKYYEDRESSKMERLY